jgi:hypothetical protein
MPRQVSGIDLYGVSKKAARRRVFNGERSAENVQPITFSAAPASLIYLRFNSDLEHTIAMLGKEPVGIDNAIEFEAVDKQGRQVEPLVKHHLHQAPHLFFSPRAKRRDDLVISKTCGKRLQR